MEDKDLKRKCLMVTKKSRSVAGLTFLMVMLSSSQVLASTMTDADTQDLVNSIIEVQHDGYEVVNLSSSNDGDTLYGLDNLFGKQDGETTNNINTTPITSEPTATPTPTPQVSGNVQVENGYVNIDKGTSIRIYDGIYTARLHKISINTNAKYSGLVKEVLKHFGTAVMYPSAGCVYMMESYYDSYTTFNTSANKKFLAGIADKYKLCDTEDSYTTKSRVVLAVFYGCYNNNDGTVNYNKNNDARILRKEFYALMCKFTQGTDTSWVFDSGLGIDSPWEYMDEFLQRNYWDPKWIYKKAPILKDAGRIYAPYVDWMDTAPISDIATKADLNSNIKRVEIIYTIAKMYGSYAAEEYEGQSITKYCSDIKSSQIISNSEYEKIMKKHPNYSRVDFTKYCLTNKLVPSWWQPYIIAAIKKGIITPNAKNELGLFNNVTYNQAINYLCNFDIPE